MAPTPRELGAFALGLLIATFVMGVIMMDQESRSARRLEFKCEVAGGVIVDGRCVRRDAFIHIGA